MTSIIDPNIEDAMASHKYILITNGHSFVGYTSAIYIAEQLEKYRPQKKHWKVRVLCDDKSKLKDLEKRGIEVHEVDYSSTHMISEQMKDKIKVMILVPCVEYDGLMEQGRNLIDCAIKNKINRIVMVSLVGCQLYKPDGPLSDYHKLEKYLGTEQKFGYWTIFRIPFVQQFFYFWANMVENGVLGLPLSKNDAFYDVNIQDVCESLAQISLSKKHAVWITQENLDLSANIKRVFELRCGPLSFEDIASQLSHALQEYDGIEKIKAIPLTDDQFKRYLDYMSNEDVSSIQKLLQEIRKIDQSSSSTGILTSPPIYHHFTTTGHEDSPSFIPRPREVITPFFINLMMDCMKMIRGNQPLPDMPNQDIRDLTGKTPIHLDKFFTSNLRHFRPRE